MTGSKKNDIKDKKSRLDLIPPWIIMDIGHVMRMGIEKYAAYNYRTYPGLKFSTLLAAAKRHILEFEMGEDKDKETKKNHLINSMCELIFVLDSQINGYHGQDDRVKNKL